MVQLSSPSSSLEIEWVSPVPYFDSLTPDLRESDDEWDYKDIERIVSDDNQSTNENKSNNNKLNPINNINRNLIPSNDNNNMKAPERGQSIPLRGP
jgi:hypothetical protein